MIRGLVFSAPPPPHHQEQGLGVEPVTKGQRFNQPGNTTGLPRWLKVGKESACNIGDTGHLGSILGSERSSGEGNDKPLLYSCLKKSHGQRSLVGYRP